MILDRNPLIELFYILNNITQFRLSDQDQRNEKLIIELKIQHEANFLEGRPRYQLSFINDQNRAFFILLVFENLGLDHVRQIDFHVGLGAKAELKGDLLQKFVGVEAGIRDQTDFTIAFHQLLDEDPAEGGFAAPDIPGQKGATLLSLNGIQKSDQGLLVFL